MSAVQYVLGAVIAAFALIGGGALLMCAGCVTAAGQGARSLDDAMSRSPFGSDPDETESDAPWDYGGGSSERFGR